MNYKKLSCYSYLSGIFLVAKFSVQHLTISVQFLGPSSVSLQMRLKPVALVIHWSSFVPVFQRKMFSFPQQRDKLDEWKINSLLSSVVFQITVAPYWQGILGGQAKCQWFSIQCKSIWFNQNNWKGTSKILTYLAGNFYFLEGPFAKLECLRNTVSIICALELVGRILNVYISGMCEILWSQWEDFH